MFELTGGNESTENKKSDQISMNFHLPGFGLSDRLSSKEVLTAEGKKGFVLINQIPKLSIVDRMLWDKYLVFASV